MVRPCGSTIPLSVAEELVTFVAAIAKATGGPVALRGGKGSVHSVSRAVVIRGNYLEMIGGTWLAKNGLVLTSNAKRYSAC